MLSKLYYGSRVKTERDRGEMPGEPAPAGSDLRGREPRRSLAVHSLFGFRVTALSTGEPVLVHGEEHTGAAFGTELPSVLGLAVLSVEFALLYRFLLGILGHRDHSAAGCSPASPSAGLSL